MVMKNTAWNLEQGDGLQFADSSFTIKDNEYARIQIYGACDGDKVVVLSIDDAPPNCEDLEHIATCFAILQKCNAIITVGSQGRYIIAREAGEDAGDIKSLNASVRVSIMKISENIRFVANEI